MTNAISQTTSPFLKSVIATSPNNQTTRTQATVQPTQAQLTPKEEFDRDVFLKEYIKEKEKEGVKASLIQAGTSLATLALSLYCISNIFKNIGRGSSKAQKAITSVWEDISSALKINDMSLPKELKELLNSVVKTIQNPENIIQKGGKPIKSILLYGPPGTGKTTFAKAIAKEFPNSQFASLDVTRLGSKFVGETEKNIQAAVNEICQQAHQNPQTKFFVFIDEIDSVMMVDNGNSKKYSNDVLNEFKKCFTERLGKEDNIITIGATNLTIDTERGIALGGKVLDKPMLDRFQEKIFVGLPNKEQIRDFFVANYQGKTMVDKTLQTKNSKELDKICEFLADKKHDVSFRTLQALFNNAATIGDPKAQTTILDIFNAIKAKQKELKITNEELEQLAKSLNIN